MKSHRASTGAVASAINKNGGWFICMTVGDWIVT